MKKDFCRREDLARRVNVQCVLTRMQTWQQSHTETSGECVSKARMWKSADRFPSQLTKCTANNNYLIKSNYIFLVVWKITRGVNLILVRRPWRREYMKTSVSIAKDSSHKTDDSTKSTKTCNWTWTSIPTTWKYLISSPRPIMLRFFFFSFKMCHKWIISLHFFIAILTFDKLQIRVHFPFGG